MAGFFSSSSSGYFGSSAPAPVPSGSGGGGHGVFGFVKNLASDVKGAVEGFVPGVIHFAEHPVGATEQMGKAMWSTWSPLFHGQFTKFGQGIYEHPLAPLLDIASVFSLGVGTAARIGAGMDALAAPAAEADAGLMASRGVQVARALNPLGRYNAPGGQLAKDAQILSEAKKAPELRIGPSELAPAKNIFHAAARYRLPAGKFMEDPTDLGRRPVVKNLSQTPGRRLLNQVVGKGFDKLPPQLQGYLGRKIYERTLYADAARRMVYRNASEAALITASDRVGKLSAAHAEAEAGAVAGHFPTFDHLTMSNRLLEDPVVGPKLRTQLAMNQFLNLATHAPFVAPTVEHAAAFLMRHGENMGFIMRPIDHTDTLLGKLNSRIEHFTTLAQKHAAVRSVDKIQQELDYHNAQLKDMYENGYLHTQTPALNSKGEPALNPTARQSMEQHAQPILEHQRAIKGLEREMKRSSKSQAILERAHSKLDELHQQRIDLEQRGANHVFEHWGMSHESLTRFANNFGRIATRRGARYASEEELRNVLLKHGWVNADGSVPLVPMGDAQMLGKEMAGGLQFVHSLGKATRWWKFLQLKLSPKVLMNNGLANHTIAMFRHSDPVTAFRALYHAYRLSHGKDFADQVLQDAMLRGGHKGWLMRAAGAELHNNLIEGAYEDLSQEGLASRAAEMKAKAGRVKRVMHGPMMYGPVAKFADQPVRLGAMYTYVTREPEVIQLADKLQGLARREGRKLSRTEALDQAAGRVLERNPDLRNRASDFGRSIAGDYLAQTPKEQAIKNFVPFYLWDRHIAKSGANIVLDTPIRAAVAQQVSQQGLAEAQKYLGNLPEFLQGAIPLQMLGMSGTSGGRMNAIVGPSLNPFGTLGEFAGAAQSLVTGGDLSQASDLLGQINPILTDALNAAAGKNLVTGSSLKGPSGLIPNTLYNLASGFPQEKIIQSAVQGPITTTTTPSGKTYPKLYAQNELAAISNFLGVPIKQISPSTAQYEAKAQAPRRKKIGNYF